MSFSFLSSLPPKSRPLIHRKNGFGFFNKTRAYGVSEPDPFTDHAMIKYPRGGDNRIPVYADNAGQV